MGWIAVSVVMASGWWCAIAVRMRWMEDRERLLQRVAAERHRLQVERVRCERWRDAAQLTLRLVEDDAWRSTVSDIAGLPEVDR